MSLITYVRSAAILRNIDTGSPEKLLPGDLVNHWLCEGSLGVIVARASECHGDERFVVMWSKPPGKRRQADDAIMDVVLRGRP